MAHTIHHIHGVYLFMRCMELVGVCVFVEFVSHQPECYFVEDGPGFVVWHWCRCKHTHIHKHMPRDNANTGCSPPIRHTHLFKFIAKQNIIYMFSQSISTVRRRAAVRLTPVSFINSIAWMCVHHLFSISFRWLCLSSTLSLSLLTPCAISLIQYI